MRYIPEDKFKRFFIKAHKLNLWSLYLIVGLFLIGFTLLIIGLEESFFAIVLSFILLLPYGFCQIIIMIASGIKLKYIIDQNFYLYYAYWLSVIIALSIIILIPGFFLLGILLPMILSLVFTSIMAKEEYYELIEEEE